ncbi:hypothetical protein WR25_17086 [Diploscapter pachys]|uniref:Uncharacterized protein n=1 Tax=Diploscapter pachys TaxID=2018661 RepID=A0A2A2L4J3_9BILA|nr:hypothetical protein WR25_17086 [Diploscapter pachys]
MLVTSSTVSSIAATWVSIALTSWHAEKKLKGVELQKATAFTTFLVFSTGSSIDAALSWLLVILQNRRRHNFIQEWGDFSKGYFMSVPLTGISSFFTVAVQSFVSFAHVEEVFAPLHQIPIHHGTLVRPRCMVHHRREREFPVEPESKRICIDETAESKGENSFRKSSPR